MRDFENGFFLEIGITYRLKDLDPAGIDLERIDARDCVPTIVPLTRLQ